MPKFTRKLAFSGASLALIALVGCNGPANTASASGERMTMSNTHTIQAQTTLNLSGTGSVEAAPDEAFITAGVQEERETAQEALAAASAAMNGVFEALAAHNIEARDMQTSQLQLYPRYDHVRRPGNDNSTQVLRGYVVSSNLSIRVRNIDDLGPVLDSMVSSGGNQFQGLRFSLADPSAQQAEARKLAIQDAIAKADAYAEAAGYRVARIVTISEGGGYQAPQPMAMMRAAAMESSPMPVAGGELSFSANVNVEFELVKEG